MPEGLVACSRVCWRGGCGDGLCLRDELGALKVFIFFVQASQLLPLFGVRGSAGRVAGSLFFNFELAPSASFLTILCLASGP